MLITPGDTLVRTMHDIIVPALWTQDIACDRASSIPENSARGKPMLVLGVFSSPRQPNADHGCCTYAVLLGDRLVWMQAPLCDIMRTHRHVTQRMSAAVRLRHENSHLHPRDPRQRKVILGTLAAPG